MSEADEDAKAMLEHIQKLRSKKDIDWKAFRESELFDALWKSRANYDRKDWDDLK